MARPDEVLFTVSVLGVVSARQVRVEPVPEDRADPDGPKLPDVDLWIGPARLRLPSLGVALQVATALRDRVVEEIAAVVAEVAAS